jgi:hypothetical protein
MSAAAAESVRRGSTTISVAPRACASRIRPHRIGWQADALEPSSRMQSVSSRSAYAGGGPSAPNVASYAATADDMHSRELESTLLVPREPLASLLTA